MKYKKSENTLKLVSILPQNIFGAKVVWLYNTKYRKITYLISEKDSTLSIKGTSIIQYDKELTKTKMMRKPKFFLEEFMSLGKIKQKKLFESIKTKSQDGNGRLNNDIIILKVYK